MKVHAKHIIFLVIFCYYLFFAIASLFTDFGVLWHNLFGVPNAKELFLGDFIKIAPNFYPLPIYVTLGISHGNPTFLTVICLFQILIYFYASWCIIPQKLPITETIYYSLLMISPVFAFAVVRGQSDMLIFSVLTLAVFSQATQHGAYKMGGGFLTAFLLKLYPLATYPILFRQFKPKHIFIFFAVVSCTAIYFWLAYPAIHKVVSLDQQAFSNNTWHAFGAVVFFNLEKNFAPILALNTIIPKKITAYSLVLIVCLTALGLNYLKKANFLYQENNRNFLLFLVGAWLYVGLFVIGVNYEYKLIALLFVMPQLMTWRKETHLKYFIHVFLGLLLYLVWSPALGMEFEFPTYNESKLHNLYAIIKEKYILLAMLLNDIVTWLIFAIFIYLLIATQPQEIKKILKL
jgi:hypothetical protein